MAGTKHHSALYKLLAGLLLLLPAANLPAQPADKAWQVRWVGQFPPDRYTARQEKFIEKLGAWVLGKKPGGLITPMAVEAADTALYWILDQKTGRITEVRNGKAAYLKIKNTSARIATLVDFCRVPGWGLIFSDARAGKLYLLPEGRKQVQELASGLQQPTGVAWHPAREQLWVAETAAHRLTVLNQKGEQIRTVGQRGNKQGEFNYPTHIWIDNRGQIYVTDGMNFRVQVFSGAGTFLHAFGQPGDATGYFARPKGVATDSYGHIYVVDALFHTVQIFDRQGVLLYHFGRQGREPGNFWLPGGIYIDSHDYIYIADSYNSRVQIFKLESHE